MVQEVNEKVKRIIVHDWMKNKDVEIMLYNDTGMPVLKICVQDTVEKCITIMFAESDWMEFKSLLEMIDGESTGS